MPNISKKSFHILNPRLDPNFKAIFTQNTQASKIALKSFLSAAIGRDVKEVTVVQNEDASFYKFQRSVDYDINCEFSDGTKAQVEMQGFDQQYDYGKRAEYYAARLVSSVMEVGDEYQSSDLPYGFKIEIEYKQKVRVLRAVALSRAGKGRGLRGGENIASE
ncbi:MAG: PD-(D/E)XK nuclease family transposase [Treponema sp.]|nr:PD-(D/E)XK nuclease family transposase [Treponema sp.]